jgi:flagellar M-ring protein FliF
MTEFTQKVNYQRALVGELERTIASLDAVDTVRVHIVTPEKSLFSNDQKPATASVTLKIKPGKRIDTNQVNAITNLIANSVEGMKPEKVVIVDTNGKMLTNTNAGSEQLNTLTQADSHQQIEQQEAQNIQQKVQTMLDSVLGVNHSSVQASVLMDWSQRETTSQTFNPTPAAVRSSKIVNESYTLGGATGGVPGAASNLPTPVATVTVPGNNTIYSHTEQTTNYEITQVQSKEVVTPGQIKRVTVSVMVDGIKDANALTSLKTAIAAAAGIDTARGDTVAVESMAFDRSQVAQQEAAEAQQSQMDLYIRMGEIGAAVVALIALLVFVMKLFSNLRTTVHQQWKPVMLSVNEISKAAGLQAHSPNLAFAGAASEALPAIQASNNDPAVVQQVQNRIGEIMARNTPSPEDEQLQKLMEQLTEDNPATVAEIIQMWLSEDEKRHG